MVSRKVFLYVRIKNINQNEEELKNEKVTK